MNSKRYDLWKEGEYSYRLAAGFKPNMVSYLHEDTKIRPSMIVVPGGGYFFVSPSEGEIVAKEFFNMGYNAFVVTYTTNVTGEEPLGDQPMKDLSRAIRLIRKNSGEYHIDENKVYLCGFSAGAHLCGSVCVHYKDIRDSDSELNECSARPCGAVLSYPVITSGNFAHRDSFIFLLGKDADEDALNYYSLEKQVTKDTPPIFLWHTITDELVPVENSILLEAALRKEGVAHALHLFSCGHHGLSLGNEDWVKQRFGNPYTLEQLIKTREAVISNEIQISEDRKKELLTEYEPQGDVESTYPEIEKWPLLADEFIKNLENR